MKIDAVQLAGLLSYVAKAADVDTADSIAAHVAALEKERDAALADNAALVKQVTGVAPYLAAHGFDLRGTAFTRPHPGAALLEEHRKALVHARNEGLREADAKILKTAEPPAYFREHHPDRNEYVAALGGYSVGVNHALDTIRSMKEPESD